MAVIVMPPTLIVSDVVKNVPIIRPIVLNINLPVFWCCKIQW